MGGSGGRLLPSFSPDEFRKKVSEADAKHRDEAFESDANQLIDKCLTQFNSRDSASINRTLEKIKTELTDQLEDTVDLLFGGSVAKRTHVEGLSDVDALLLLKPEVTAELLPDEIKQLCAERLRELFGRENVWVGDLAVTVKADEIEIQLVPAVRDGEHFKIGSPNGKSWERIRPRTFAAMLTDANGKLGNKLVPTIKLAKALIAQLPEQKRLNGYHVEALALKIFEGYRGELTPRSMLKHFFKESSKQLAQPIPDVTGQSEHVDEYLGEAGSLQRRIVADACDRIGRRMYLADAAKDLAFWRQLFGEDTTA